MTKLTDAEIESGIQAAEAALPPPPDAGTRAWWDAETAKRYAHFGALAACLLPRALTELKMLRAEREALLAVARANQDAWRRDWYNNSEVEKALFNPLVQSILNAEAGRGEK